MNLVPFITISRYLNAWDVVDPMVVITNIYGNILAFLPFGMLGPVVLSVMRKFKATFFYSLLLSLTIEVVQGLLGVGVVDVDDLILNVFGGVIGYGFYVILLRPTVKKSERK